MSTLMGSEVSYLFTLPASGGDAIVEALNVVGAEKSDGYCQYKNIFDRLGGQASSK